MSLRLTCCGRCGKHFPKVKETIERLQEEHPDDVRVVELKCMAACRQAPAVMVDYDFYPQVDADELYAEVNTRLADSTADVERLATCELAVA